MKTTIDFNGLRIEHGGGDTVLISSEAPTEIAISDLIKELNSLLPKSLFIPHQTNTTIRHNKRKLNYGKIK